MSPLAARSEVHPQVFHVELRQFPHQARSFNLTREQLDTRILEPWCSGAPIELQDRRWTSEKAKLTILEGPELRPDEIGLGRGWNNATRSGQDVTTKLLEEARESRQAPADELKEAIVAACAGSAIVLAQVVAVAAAREPQRRPSELLGAAEQGVWELLHAGRLRLLRHGDEVPRERWQAVLLPWSSWTGGDVTVQATA
ncbi:MAG: hypothetical protein ACXVH3_17175 [Solirubrobacteraceae bacterium]